MDVKGLFTGGFKMDHDFRTVRKVLRGNIECFEELILKYESRVYRTCWRFVGNSNDAEDITQEVFIRIYNNLSKFKKNSSFSTWIYRITVNTAAWPMRL
jgi:RNA polymerase sigma-70 factor (ECF subfamily)